MKAYRIWLKSKYLSTWTNGFGKKNLLVNLSRHSAINNIIAINRHDFWMEILGII